MVGLGLVAGRGSAGAVCHARGHAGCPVQRGRAGGNTTAHAVPNAIDIRTLSQSIAIIYDPIAHAIAGVRPVWRNVRGPGPFVAYADLHTAARLRPIAVGGHLGRQYPAAAA